MTPQVALDDAADVLYVRIPNAKLTVSRPAPSDSFLILNESALGEIVGVQILYASDLFECWPAHPDKSLLPAPIAHAIDEWLASRH